MTKTIKRKARKRESKLQTSKPKLVRAIDHAGKEVDYLIKDEYHGAYLMGIAEGVRSAWETVCSHTIPFIHALREVRASFVHVESIVLYGLKTGGNHGAIRAGLLEERLDQKLLHDANELKRLTPPEARASEEFERVIRIAHEYNEGVQSFLGITDSPKIKDSNSDYGVALIAAYELYASDANEILDRIESAAKKRGPKIKLGREVIARETYRLEHEGMTQREIVIRLQKRLDDPYLPEYERAAIECLKGAKNKTQYLRDCKKDYPKSKNN